MRILLWLLAALWSTTFRLAAENGTALGVEPVQARMEEMARRYTHFSPTVIIKNRSLRFSPFDSAPADLGEEQLRLLAELRELSSNRAALIPLLNHPDPKVRTLALGSLFQREEGPDLPLIAGLLNDTAGTFPLLREPMRAGGMPSRSEWESAQSVADVVQSMLAFWGVGDPNRDKVSASQFELYWAKYAGRRHAAHWFRVKMDRATRRTIPIQEAHRPDMDRVLAQINALPSVDRAWTSLFVLCPAGNYHPQSVAEHRLVLDQKLVETARELGAESLLRFLRRERVTDDPDLDFSGKESGDFGRMSHFILAHARDLFRPTDAEALLAMERPQPGETGPDPAWAIAAAALQPDKASALLRSRLQKEKRNYVDAAGQLAGALWRIVGLSECAFLREWFYSALRNAAEPFHQPEIFLTLVGAAGRKDTTVMLRALVQDPRFDLTDWPALKEMLLVINAQQQNPLVTQGEIYDFRPQTSANVRRALARWRNLLRDEFKLAERPTPPESPQPRRTLRQPAYAVPIPTTAATAQLIVSPSGRLLATLREGNVEVWDAASGQAIWNLPRGKEAWCLWMAFGAPDDHLLLLYQETETVLAEWDVKAGKRLSSTAIRNQPTSGVSGGAYAFDQTAGRFALAGPNEVACFDARTGRGLWIESATEGGQVVCLSPDGTLLAFGRGRRMTKGMQLRDATEGRLLRTFDQFAGGARIMAFTADGNGVAAASDEDGLRLWNVKTGQLEREFGYPAQRPVAGVSFSTDGRWLAVSSVPITLSEARIGIYQMQTGGLEFEIACDHAGIAWYALAAFSPDGQVLYTVDKDLAAWQLNLGK